MAPVIEPTAPLSVLLVDDQAMLRTGFAMILSVEDDIQVVGQASNGREAIEQVAALHPDVVLMDVQMPVMDGIQATTELVSAGATKVIILTTFDRDDYLFDALHAGASGFLLKNSEPEVLVEAVRAVGHGHALLSPEVTRRVIEQMMSTPEPGTPSPISPEAQSALALLTDREREVLVLLADGLSNAEIAAHLVVGEATVKTHVSNVLAKLHLRDRVQAVVFAHRAGLAQR